VVLGLDKLGNMCYNWPTREGCPDRGWWGLVPLTAPALPSTRRPLREIGYPGNVYAILSRIRGPQYDNRLARGRHAACLCGTRSKSPDRSTDSVVPGPRRERRSAGLTLRYRGRGHRLPMRLVGDAISPWGIVGHNGKGRANKTG